MLEKKKKISKVTFLFTISCLLWFNFLFLIDFVEAKGASLSIFPQIGNFTVGNTFDVSVFLNTGGDDISAVKVDLQFDPEILQVITPSKGLSEVEGWIFPPSFSNQKGTITLQGGFSVQTINTSEGLISVIVFKAISSGKTIVDFLDSSKVLIGEGEGVNILTSVNRGVYNIIPPPPKGPRIFSETHPDQNKWSKNPNPTFSWERIDEAIGYSYKLDEDPQGEPDNSIDTSVTSISFENITDGVKYFHVKAIKSQVWGGTSHFQIKIDIVPPNSFEPYLEPFSLTLGNSLLIYFNAVDRLSGIDYYQVRVANLNDPQNIIFSVWTQEESPFELTKEQSGTMSVLVRAFDKAGNFQEGNIRIRILSSPLVFITGGIQIIGIFIPWWVIYIILSLALLAPGRLLFKFLERFEKSDKRLTREIKEAEKEIEDIRRFKEQERKEKEHDITSREKAERKWRQLREDLRRETKPSEEDEKSDDYE
jgi:hypothetical protein